MSTPENTLDRCNRDRIERATAQAELFTRPPGSPELPQQALKCMHPGELQAFVLGLAWSVGQRYEDDWTALAAKLRPRYKGVARLIAGAQTQRVQLVASGAWPKGRSVFTLLVP